MTEAVLLRLVVAAAVRRGILVFHSGDSVRDIGPGFPDLCLVSRRLLFAELKSATGSLSPDQVTWKYRLLAAGHRWVLWRPVDWPDLIEAELDTLAAA
jgi:hypothetical protein